MKDNALQNPDLVRKITLLVGILSFVMLLPACNRAEPSPQTPLPASPTWTPRESIHTQMIGLTPLPAPSLAPPTPSLAPPSPTGMYVADLATGTIEKPLTPAVVLWDVSFSPDRTQIAYRTSQGKPVPDSMPQAEPPFTLNLTDLTTGRTKILLESETEQYFHPIWSPDGNRLAYSVRPGQFEADTGIYSIDLATGEETLIIPGSEDSRLTAWYWLPQDKLAYTEGGLSYDRMFIYPEEGYPFSGKMWNHLTTLYTINIDGTDKYAIDGPGGFIVIGSIGY